MLLIMMFIVIRYDEALSFHQQALVLRPLNPSTYSAIGFVQVCFLSLYLSTFLLQFEQTKSGNLNIYF